MNKQLDFIRKSPLLRYGIAIGLVLGITLLRHAFSFVLGEDAPLLMYIIAVTISASVGGFRGGVLATVLSGIAGTYFFIEPFNSFYIAELSDGVRIAIFLFEGVVISWIVALLQKSQLRTEEKANELLESEETLRYQKSLLEAQREVSPTGVLIVSPTGKMLSHNHRFAEMWKFPKKVMETGLDEAALQAAQEQLENPEDFIKRVLYLYKHRKASHEKLLFKDGRIFDRYGAPVKGKGKKYYGYVWYFLDITEREKLAKQKDEFIGIVSHELKTPVTSIKGYTQIMHSRFVKSGDKQSALFLEKMDAQLNKLGSLIGDLLDVTKIEGGRLQFHEDWFDFNELVQEVVEDMQRTTDKHHIVTKLGKTKSVRADRDRIGQVLINLLSNAIKYSPHTDKIAVSTTRNKENVTVCVKDFGVGIPKEKRDKVFDRFFRVSGPRQETFPGMGLGLYISSEIVKRQGGKIWVESASKGSTPIKSGSIFCFMIPVNAKKK